MATTEPVFVSFYVAQESITSAWQAGTSNRGVVPASQAGNRLLGSLKGFPIRALVRGDWRFKRKLGKYRFHYVDISAHAFRKF